MRFPLKTILVTALLVTLPTVVAGQTLGFRGGLSLATFGGNDAGNAASRTALSFGGFFNVPVSNVLSVQVGAGLARKGVGETELGPELQLKLELKLDYLEIPILLTFSPPATGDVGFNFFIGPALGFKTSCTVIASNANVIVNSACGAPSLDPPLKSVDLGAMVGAGLDIGLTANASLVLDGFYNLGLTNIDDSGVDNDTKNRAFSILAGLSFSLGR